MKLAPSETIKKRLAARNTKTYNPPKNYGKNNVRIPRQLKHNAGDGGDYVVGWWLASAKC